MGSGSAVLFIMGDPIQILCLKPFKFLTLNRIVQPCNVSLQYPKWCSQSSTSKAINTRLRTIQDT